MSECIKHKDDCNYCKYLKLVVNETFDKNTNESDINIDVSQLFKDKNIVKFEYV